VSGLARAREWDVVATAECDATDDECVYVRTDRRIVERGDAAVSACLDAALEGLIDPPYRAVGHRREETLWAVGAVAIEVAELPADQEGEELVLTLTDGEAELLVDGERQIEGIDALMRLAGARYDAFVLRAQRLQGRLWEVAIDPL
jgi:hypothetical protein